MPSNELPSEPSAPVPPPDFSHLPPPEFPPQPPRFRLPVKKLLITGGSVLLGGLVIYVIDAWTSQKNDAVHQQMLRNRQTALQKKRAEAAMQRQMQAEQRAKEVAKTEATRKLIEQKQQEATAKRLAYQPKKLFTIPASPYKKSFKISFHGTAAFGLDGKTILTLLPYKGQYSSSYLGCQRLDIRTGTPLGEIVKAYRNMIPDNSDVYDITAVWETPDQQRLILSSDSDSYVYHCPTGRIEHKLPFATGEHVAFSQDSKYAALAESPIIKGESTGFIRICDLATGARLHDICIGAGRDIFVEFSASGDRLLARNSKRAELIGLQTGRTLWHTPTDASIDDAKLSPDGKVIALIHNHRLEFWDAKTGEKASVQPKQNFFLFNGRCHFSEDGARLLVHSMDTATVINTATGETIGKEIKHEAMISYACIAPSGRFIVTAREPLDGMRAEESCEVQIWDVESGEKFGQPMKHTLPVAYMEISKDGTRLITQEESDRGTSHLWDIAAADNPAAP